MLGHAHSVATFYRVEGQPGARKMIVPACLTAVVAKVQLRRDGDFMSRVGNSRNATVTGGGSKSGRAALTCAGAARGVGQACECVWHEDLKPLKSLRIVRGAERESALA